ncbi:VCBS repeat-containing protein [Sphingomonas sp. ID1715]|uniref:FG-GAP-like repeat-containing protein n=1 Tax=Sphingomonas sp. ID1715 TaxID=1656898 RepID=UPI0014883607|nr:FG-GAP-like repeat-containing protein [Sphingomonas sp. ID1715]NNM76319.1 VCBS repeat-containing protein [Sphingomonas sp. ID1715]
MHANHLAAAVALSLSTAVAAQEAPQPAFFVGTGAGSSIARVDGYDAGGKALASILPYNSFTGGVRVATGDVNGDGLADLVTGAGPGGGPHVKVFDGSTGTELRSFFAYEAGFVGGVQVATGDLDGDGRAEVVTGAGAGGGPHVRVFSGADGSVRQSFFAFGDGFTGGVSVAVGDFAGDGRADVIVGAGAGGGGHVRVFDGLSGDVRADFFAFENGYAGGMSLATGDFLGQHALFVGAGEGSAPLVRIFALDDARLLGSFLAFDPGFTGGVNVGFARLNGRDTLLTGMASRGGTLGLVDVGTRRNGGGRADQQGATEFLTPFGPNYVDGLSVAGVAAPVPEPASWALMLTGFAAAGFGMRRRLQAPAASVNAA